jgi:hypothetical protein
MEVFEDDNEWFVEGEDLEDYDLDNLIKLQEEYDTVLSIEDEDLRLQEAKKLVDIIFSEEEDIS